MRTEVDMLVIGSGPAGQGAALEAAALGLRVVVVDGPDNLGGRSVRAGAIEAHTLRAARSSTRRSSRPAGPPGRHIGSSPPRAVR